MVNSDLIEFIEQTPNTVISMSSGRKLVVAETCEEIREKIIAYKRAIHSVDNSEWAEV
jgi:flagellar protein FlbD